MAQSTQRAVSNGSLVLLDLSIDYLDRSEITVYFNAVRTNAWAWVGTTAKRITFSPAVPNGVEVLVKRTTNISKLRHEFSKGAAFTAEVLDEDLTQVLHIAQEASEANLSGQFYSDIDMHNYRIRNIGTAVDNTDALTLGQYKADANGAFASKTAAANSATAAAGYATTAMTHATDAGNSATAAANSASAAATSVTNAANASRLTAGTVTTGAPGTAAAVSITGGAGAQVLNVTVPRGDVGAAGPANTLAIGTVASGPSAAATITGSAPNQTLNLTLPKGDAGNPGATGPAGPANTLSIGTVVASAPGSAAAATITGTAPNQTLNLTLPRGETGPQGPQGATGPQGPAGTGSGDVLGPGTATVDNELVLWNGTTGTSIKRASFSGLVKSTAGVASAAVAGTDYVEPSGNVATATALQTARTINGTSFNGSANITTSLWGTSRTVTIGGTGKAVDGSADVSWSLAEIGAQAADADLTAIAALSGTSGLLRKTAADTWALDTSAYITGNQTIAFSGDVTGSGTTAVTLTLANSGATAGTYRSVTVDQKGRVTAGTNPTTLAGYGITDAQTTLVSGTNIKTINGVSLLGYGNISISGGGVVGTLTKADMRTPCLVKTGSTALAVKAGTVVHLPGGTVTYNVQTTVTMPPLNQGRDYSVWVLPNGTVQAVADHYSSPATAPTQGAVKIGGFHYGLVTPGLTPVGGGFSTSGFTNMGGSMIWTQADVNRIAGINEFSIWDLMFRSAGEQHGMTFDPLTRVWWGIYLCSTEHIAYGISVYNTNVASDTVLPRIPLAYGGDGVMTYGRLSLYEAVEITASHNCRLPSYEEFMSAAFGVTEGQALGGASSTIPATARQAGYTSRIGIEQATGHHWIIGAPFSAKGGTELSGVGRGSIYGTTGMPLFGGHRGMGSNAGSRCAGWHVGPFASDLSIGLRAVCDHYHGGY